MDELEPWTYRLTVERANRKLLVKNFTGRLKILTSWLNILIESISRLNFPLWGALALTTHMAANYFLIFKFAINFCCYIFAAILLPLFHRYKYIQQSLSMYSHQYRSHLLWIVATIDHWTLFWNKANRMPVQSYELKRNNPHLCLR